jgi:uncharacterized delta-60 repeat protein
MYEGQLNKIFIGGFFQVIKIGDTEYKFNRFARFQTTGGVDTTFRIGSGFDDYVSEIVGYTGDTMLVGGNFNNYSGVTTNKIVLLDNLNAYIVPTFKCATLNGFVNVIKPQSDGKILVGGVFDTYSGVTVNNIVRLNSDGSIDETFTIGNGFDAAVYAIDIQPDGKILVSGEFTEYDFNPSDAIVRLNSDGTFDFSFVSLGFDFPYVNSIKYLNFDDTIIIGGAFSTYSGATLGGLVKLNLDGSINLPFSGNSTPFGLVDESFLFFQNVTNIREDGSEIIVGGQFTSYKGQPAYNYIRLTSDGILIKNEYPKLLVSGKFTYEQAQTGYTSRSIPDVAHVNSMITGITSNYWRKDGNTTLSGDVLVTLGTGTTNLSLLDNSGSLAGLTVGQLSDGRAYVGLAGHHRTNGDVYFLSLDAEDGSGLGAGAKFFDYGGSPRGLQYGANYTATFAKHSLVDKSYVTGTTYLTANNGITKNGSNFRLGGTLTGNTVINTTGGTAMLSLRGSGRVLFNQSSLQSTNNLVEINGVLAIYSSASRAIQLNTNGRIFLGSSTASAGIGSVTNQTSTFNLAGNSMGYFADQNHSFIINNKPSLSANQNNYVFGGGFTSSVGSGIGTFVNLQPVHSTSGGTPTIIGLHYNPTGSIGSATHVAIKTSAGSVLIGNSSGNTITTNTKFDIRGIGVVSGGTILRLADNINTTRFEIRDTGVARFTNNVGIGTTTFPTDSRVVSRGSDSSSLNYAGRFENSAGSLIGQFRNDQVFELGGTSAILEVNQGIQSGNAALKFLSYTGGTGLGYRFQDNNLNDYINMRSLTTDRAVVMRQPVEYDYNQGYKRVTKQYTVTTTTTNSAQTVIFEIPVVDNEHYDVKVLHADATSPNASSITSMGIDAADVRKLSGSTITGNTVLSTLSKLPNSLTGNFNWNIDTVNNKLQYRFQNDSSGGKEYVIWIEISYVKRATPILE